MPRKWQSHMVPMDRDKRNFGAVRPPKAKRRFAFRDSPIARLARVTTYCHGLASTMGARFTLAGGFWLSRCIGTDGAIKAPLLRISM